MLLQPVRGLVKGRHDNCKTGREALGVEALTGNYKQIVKGVHYKGSPEGYTIESTHDLCIGSI
jgi:hypothetical protein